MNRRGNVIKKKGRGKLTALLLTAALCAGLCAGFTADAQEPETQNEQDMQSSVSDLRAPRIEQDSNMKDKENVTWDCVWFGSYPQSEVKSSDAIYSTLQNAGEWDSNNEITVDGERYRRMKKGDASFATENSSSPFYYIWPDSTTYHYFKYEPIKWRVLKTNGSQALLLSDIVLDSQAYLAAEKDNIAVTWETSTLRSWMNGYGASSNQMGKDYSEKNFIGSAFSSSEQSAILETSVVNKDSLKHGTEGGNNTLDKVFALSETDVYGNSAELHGFLNNSEILDEARKCTSSDYAKAMGVHSGYGTSPKRCDWWLRSPGVRSFSVGSVNYDGNVENTYVANCFQWGVRAALNMDMSSDQWSDAGTVSCSRTVITVSDITLSGASKKIAAGKKIKLTAKVSPADAYNKKIAWQSDNLQIATVDDTGLVTVKAGSGGKTVTVWASALDGSGVKAFYTITSMKGAVQRITLSGISKKIAAGKNITLTPKVTASSGANKTLAWKSSNTNVAAVTSKGVVTLKKSTGGKTVTITASATDGSGKKASYKITSMKGVVTKVAVSGQKTKTVKAGKSLQLKAKVTASNTKNANRQLKWTSGNTKYATVSSAGKVMAKKAGKGRTVKITAMATDGSGKKTTVTIKIK